MSFVRDDLVCFRDIDLCRACEDIIHAFFKGADIVRMLHHDSIRSLKKAVDQHCYVCSIFWADRQTSLGKAGIAPLELLRTECSIYMNEEQKPLIKLEIFALVSEDIFANHFFTKFRLVSRPGIDNTGQSRLLDLGVDTSSAPTLDLVLKWYTLCCENHSRCSIAGAEHRDWQPTRLIDISYGDNQWRLRTSPLPDGPVQYMTLSYRWGSNTSAKLLNHNVRIAQQGLPISLLPKTFRDAIIVARQLGGRYLWIDALCIIQDSKPDWKCEAARMKYVYSHSSCNIAAFAALDQESGLFQPRSERELLPGIVTSSFPSQDFPSQHFQIYDKDYWSRQLAQGPLYNRAWVFQECLLAPRVVYFTNHQILWECNEETKCEGFPQGIPYHYRPKDLNCLWSLLNKQREYHGSTKPGDMSFQLHSFWNDILHRYSQCELTYHEDRLPAILGVAQLFANVTGDEFIAGLWRSRLVEQLVWRVPWPRSRPTTQRDIPSWSWASIEGEVQPTGLSINRKYLVSISEIERHDMLGDWLGADFQGSLKLTGAVSLLGDEGPVNDHYNHLGSRTLDAQCSFDYFDIDSELIKQGTYFLPLLTCHGWNPPKLSTTTVVGLILTPMADGRSAKFQRIGQFKTDSMEDIGRLGFAVSLQGLATPLDLGKHAELSLL